VKPLAAGALVAAAVTVPLLLPYAQVRRELGDRSRFEAEFYSSMPRDFLVAQRQNLVWGRSLGAGEHGPEDSFPGLLAIALALVALWPPLSVRRVAYALGFLFAFDAALGMHGSAFPVLYAYVVPFRGFRAPGRIAMLVGLSLAVLAGHGITRLTGFIRRPALGYVLAGALSGAVLLESWSPLPLERVAPPHAVYHWFEGRTPAVLAELPATAEPQGDLEAGYLYRSTLHWQRILNGYSGVIPLPYQKFMQAMTTFPDEASIAMLRSREVDYVCVHEQYYGREAYRKVIRSIERRTDLRERTRAVTDGYEARIYQLAR
jgi:hypothetical protein